MRQRQVSGRDRRRYGYQPPGRWGRPAPAPVALMNRRQKRLIGLGLMVIVAALLIFNAFSVSDITVSGINSKLQPQVDQEVQDVVKSHWSWGNLLTLSGAGIAQAVLAKDFELKTVTVRRHWLRGLDVMATQKQPAFIWATGGSTYLLDVDGTIIGGLGESGAKLPVVTDASNVPVKAGDRVVPAAFVQFCSTVLATLPRQVGTAVAGFTVFDTTTAVQVALVNRPYVLKFDTTRDATSQLSDLQTVLTELTKEKKTPTQYIDLRLENKAYYR